MRLKSQGKSLRYQRRVGLAAVLTILGLGCDGSGRAETRVQCLGAESRASSLVLPDSHWLKVTNHTVEKWSASGEKVWSAETPAKEPPLPGLSVAANNTVYMRDKQRLLALSSSGTWSWERAEPLQGAADASYYPAAMTDSGVVLRVDREKYRAYSADGVVRWTTEVKLQGSPIEKPLVLPNGAIIIRSLDGFVSLAPDDGIAL